MSIAINSSFTATVPAAYGASAPVINLGQSPAVIGTAAVLADAGAVVISLRGAPAGAVTYTATGLLHALAAGSAASAAPAHAPAQASAPSAASKGQGGAVSGAAGDGVYDGSGGFSPVNQASAAVAPIAQDASAAAVSASAQVAAAGAIVTAKT